MRSVSFALSCAICVGSDSESYFDVRRESSWSDTRPTSKDISRLGSLSGLLLSLSSAHSASRSSHLPSWHPFTTPLDSVASPARSRTSPLMLGGDFFDKALKGVGKALEKAGETVSKAGESIQDSRNKKENDQVVQRRGGQLGRRDQSSPASIDSFFDDAFGGGLVGGLAKNLMKGVAGQLADGMAQAAAVNDRILDSVLDAIRDDTDAQNELGFNPTIGPPMQQSTSSSNINGISTARSLLVVPVQGESGNMWNAEIEAEVSNNDNLILKRLVLRSPSGRVLRVTGGIKRGTQQQPRSRDGIIDVDVL